MEKGMGRQRFGSEQIIAKLREVDVPVGRGATAVEACRQSGIGEQTLYIGGGSLPHLAAGFNASSGENLTLGTLARPSGKRDECGNQTASAKRAALLIGQWEC